MMSFSEIKSTDGGYKMATLRPKSPKPAVPKQEKDESIWDKIGTLGRKKRIKEGTHKYEEIAQETRLFSSCLFLGILLI